ncbi:MULTISPECIES: HD domain-containing protein [unclassified Flavobacterium]|uniref:HD domain-containing protein n=1 Tax=unclassified Flavobacterium TaxID=196869 RepID=UPI000EB33036|nr:MULTISPECIES: ATP-binding protein [unclassified Flavobacterium]RKS03273.1 histidine kinase/DNA gyrase B/HSP90-like ATPase [Flavobacterium sp. 102]
MIKYLEKLLYQKTEGTQSEILFAQWNYDKKVIPTALNAVSNLFPHYSLHDESHSITIINNIVRVLGKEKIENLSAIDIWLILEASYSHDIGMVVSSEKLIEALGSSDFIDFFIEIQQDKKNGLNDFANQFKIEERKIKYNSSELNLEFHDGIKFILAEYFRRKHSDRSKDIIINPKDELQLSSPRGVIPQRIFKILADICSSHTKNFDDVMKLPFCEVGIDIEDSHPRFISCLLRIGDLLDLDNNRFSEVMLRTLSKIPIDTLNHKAKHLSIESFRVDNEIIEVEAKCFDYDTANITQHWFNYLNSEITQQMINWNKIVPFKEFGYLPTIGNLKVELLNYDYIDGKKKPKFSVDTDKALELLQGAGIYEGAYQCIREILQNAVDASLLRIWLEYKDELDLVSPNTIDFNKITKQFAINVEINEKEVIGDNKIWEFSITDKGIGLSTYDLNYLMNTGSSSKNRKKLNIIDTMPIWLRPSGTFGIGFQSIFMLTEQVNIETKSFFNEEFQIIELNSPNSIKDGGILVQKKKTSHKIKPSTKLSFNHKTKAIPDSWSIKSEHKNASRIAHNYDPFSHESLDIELGKIFDEIFDFSLKSYIPIKLHLNKTEIDTHSNKNKFKYFDEENSLELNIHHGKKENGWRVVTYYKNQKADNSLNTMFLGFELNIHKHKASEVLTLNRNKIKPEYNHKLREQLFTSAFKVIIENFFEIFQDEESRSIGSMFLNYYHNYYNFLGHFDIKKFNQWQKLKIAVADKSIEMYKLLNSIETVKLVYDNRDYLKYGDLYELKGKELIINFRGTRPAYDYTTFLLHKISEVMSSIVKIENVETSLKEIYFSKKKQKSSVNESEIKKILIKTKTSFYSSRSIIPCTEKYLKLRLNDNANESYVYQYVFDYNINLPYPKMLSPFISCEGENDITNLEIVLNDKLYEWVYKNRYDSKTKLIEIKNSYEEFIKEFKIEELN